MAITVQTALSTSSTRKGWLAFIGKISEQSNWSTKRSDKNNSVVANKCIVTYLKRCHEDAFLQLIEGDGRLGMYKEIKPVFGYEKYLSWLGNIKDKMALLRFRLSLHKLPIEKGRQSGIERSIRICKLCNINEIGDEKHYFFKCSHKDFVSIRNTFKENVYKLCNQLELFSENSLFVYLLSLKDKHLVNITGDYRSKILCTSNECSMMD